MKYDTYIIFSLILMCIGIIGIFYAGDIVEKFKIKNKRGLIRVSKAVGLILATMALIVIYILGR